jgi:hypothetical protein
VVSVEAQAKASFGQHTSKRGLAHVQRITPLVVAVQPDQVEGIEERIAIMTPVADTRQLARRRWRHPPRAGGGSDQEAPHLK